jgi:2-oxoglutarate/2-oxoacid ferredoxin oxidoreductase subunit beta
MVTSLPRLGRDPLLAGGPIKMVEILAQLNGVAFAARGSASSAKNLLKAKAYMKKAFRAQLEKKGLGIVEILSNCNTNWHKSPLEGNKFIDEEYGQRIPLWEFIKTCSLAMSKKPRNNSCKSRRPAFWSGGLGERICL